ncbi:MAG: FxSxx-COOH system tetratricopeptide repeat protein, partial [Pseudonocardiaceae bacterium]
IEVLYDEPRAPVPAAYARIAQTITAGEVDRMHPLSPRARDSYRYSLGVGSLSAQPHIFLAYAAEDRLWADWIQSLLESSGAKVARLPADDSWLDGPVRPAVLVVGSSRLAHSSTGRRAIELTERLTGTPDLADRFDLLVAQLPDCAVSAPFDELPRISLLDCDETLARRRLLRHFVLFDRLETHESPVYFPGVAATPHSRSNLPPRNGQFVGRSAVLEDMRDRFLDPGELVVCTLTGPAGTGKSQIALEYAHRFTTDYDFQWWISAQDQQSVRASLTALADGLRLPSTPDRPRAALEALQAHPRYRRWLLVYDNVSALDTLAELMPAGNAGHVILTTRELSSDGTVIGALDTEDSIELLTNLVPDLATADAALVAAQMEQLPLAVRLAAVWMSESATVMHQSVSTRAAAAAWAATEFQARAALLADEQGGSPQAAALAVILRTLAESDLGRVATRLAQMCSWLSPDAVALRLLRSNPMVGALAGAADDGQALILDPLELDRVLCFGQRYALFEMNWERPAKLTMHRVVQELLRDAMPPDEHAERQREVLHALAAFAPTDPEPEASQDITDFIELQRHLEVSGAVGSQDANVRRWLVDQIHYLRRTPSPATWHYAVDLGGQALAGWEDPTSSAESSLRMRLEAQLVALHRQRNDDVPTLLERVDDLLNRQQRLLGPTHPRTLRTWRSNGGNLRRRGLFAEACAAEERTFHGSREWLGDHHPDTRQAANNLAWSYFLAGDVSSALTLERENHRIRMALFGPDHLDVCWSAGNLGVYLRELGHYPEAIKIFNEAIERVGALKPDGSHPTELRLRWHRAIAYRNAGDPSKALEENAENLRRFRDVFGSHDGRTVRCKLSFAIDYHCTGNSAAAVSFAEESLTSYLRSDSGYPHASLHLLNLAVFRRGLGEMAQAVSLSTQAVDELVDWLGADHPWTLAATINHAHATALSDPDGGYELLRSTHEDCLDYLPTNHPYTNRAAANLESGIADWEDLYVDLP